MHLAVGSGCPSGNGNGRLALPRREHADKGIIRWRTTPCGALPVIIAKPDILLLDEPTNHLDTESVAWLEHHLKSYAGTVIAVTHDRYFLDNVAGWILELDRGYGIPWKGNYTSWLEQKQKRLQQEEKQGDRTPKDLTASWNGSE